MLKWDLRQDLPTPLELLHVLVTTPPTLDGPIVASNLARRLVVAKVEANERGNYAQALRLRAAHLRGKGGACATDIALHLKIAAECFEKTAPSEAIVAGDSDPMPQTVLQGVDEGVPLLMPTVVLQYPSEPVPHAAGKGFAPATEEEEHWAWRREFYSNQD